jgi:hypothetical protein
VAETSSTASALSAVTDSRLAAQRARRSGGFLLAMRTRWPLTVGTAVVLILLLSAIAAPLLAPANPDIQSLGRRLPQRRLCKKARG